MGDGQEGDGAGNAMRDLSSRPSAHQRAKHRVHPRGIGLAQRPRRLRIDILVAREHAAQPSLDPLTEHQVVERGAHTGAGHDHFFNQLCVGLFDTTGLGKCAAQVLGDKRQGPLRQIAEGVGEFGIDARDDRLCRIAAVLSEAHLAQ